MLIPIPSRPRDDPPAPRRAAAQDHAPESPRARSARRDRDPRESGLHDAELLLEDGARGPADDRAARHGADPDRDAVRRVARAQDHGEPGERRARARVPAGARVTTLYDRAEQERLVGGADRGGGAVTRSGGGAGAGRGG